MERDSGHALRASTRLATNIAGEAARRTSGRCPASLQQSRRRTSPESRPHVRADAFQIFASTRPATNIAGETPTATAAPRRSRSFNEAGDEHRRRVPGDEKQFVSLSCSNEAGDEHRRRARHGCLVAPGRARLQRGRRRTSPERARAPAALFHRHHASTRPATNIAGELRPARPAVAALADASTRPATNIAGESSSIARGQRSEPGLQRGRRRTSPESARDLDRGDGPLDASTRPATNIAGESCISVETTLRQSPLQRGRRRTSPERVG